MFKHILVEVGNWEKSASFPVWCRFYSCYGVCECNSAGVIGNTLEMHS